MLYGVGVWYMVDRYINIENIIFGFKYINFYVKDTLIIAWMNCSFLLSAQFFFYAAVILFFFFRILIWKFFHLPYWRIIISIENCEYTWCRLTPSNYVLSVRYLIRVLLIFQCVTHSFNFHHRPVLMNFTVHLKKKREKKE